MINFDALDATEESMSRSGFAPASPMAGVVAPRRQRDVDVVVGWRRGQLEGRGSEDQVRVRESAAIALHVDLR